MKKLLGIVVLGLLLSGNVFAEIFKCEINKKHTVVIKVDRNQEPQSLVTVDIEKGIFNNDSVIATTSVLKGELIEFKGDKITEIHLRSGNDIALNSNIGDEYYPIWKGDDVEHLKHLEFVPNLFDEDEYDADGHLSNIRLGYYRKINTQ